MDAEESIILRDDHRYVSLRRAVLAGDVPFVEQMLPQLPSVDMLFGDFQDASPLIHWAALHGQISVVKLLLKHGADVNGWNRDHVSGEYTVLHSVAEGADPDMIQCLLDAGADIHAQRYNVGTPLKSVLRHMIAARLSERHRESIAVFLDAGLDINEPRCEWGEGTVLEQAAGLGDVGLVQWLFDRGADSGDVLVVAAEFQQLKLALWLLERGERDSEARAFGRAARHGLDEVCRALLPSALAATPTQLAGALVQAAGQGQYSTTLLLLDAGVDVNHPIEYGTALYAAARNQLITIDLIRLLVDQGADVAAEDTITQQRVAHILQRDSR